MAIDAIEGSELGEVAQQDVAGGAGVSSCHVIAQRRTASIHFSTSQLPVDRPAAPTGLARVVLSDDDHSASGILPRLMDQALSETEATGLLLLRRWYRRFFDCLLFRPPALVTFGTKFGGGGGSGKIGCMIPRQCTGTESSLW